MCPPIRAHWRYLASAIKLVLTSAHLSPQPKRRIDRFSHFCTAYSRMSLYCKWAPLSPKLPLPMGDLDPHLTHDSLGQFESKTQTASRSVQPFCTDGRRVSLYFAMGRPFPLSKLPIPMGIWTPSNTWFPGPTRVLNSNGISIGSAVLQGSLVWQTDRPTDRQTTLLGR